MEVLIGSHTHFNKNDQLLGVVKETLSYNANVFMFYTGSNQSTLRFPIKEETTNAAHALMKENGINKDKCVIHAPFIINLANNSDEDKYNFYISFLIQELNRCKDLQINNLVLHPGSHVSVPKDKALDNIVYGLDKAFESVKDVNILLEFMSGKGTEMCTNLSDFKYIFDNVKNKENLYVCLDTCHLNDAGIDISKFDEFLNTFDELIGIDKIKCVHINDSKNTLGTHKDRHANIGHGTIGFDNLINVIYHEKLKSVPKILETPYIDNDKYKDYPPYKEEIEMIRNKTFTDFINQ